MAVLLRLYFGLRATLQTVVSVCEVKGTVSDTEVLASGIDSPAFDLGLIFFSCLSVTYRSPGNVGMACLLMMPLSMPAS